MVIRALDYVQQCFNNADGNKILRVILPLLKQGKVVVVSFEGVPSLPSSFVNSAFIALLDHMTFSAIRKQLRFSHTNSQMNEMIKSRFEFEVKRKLLQSDMKDAVPA